MKCLDCNTNEALQDPFYGVLPCASCQKSNIIELKKGAEFLVPSKQDRIQRQRDKYRKDLLQPTTEADGTPSREFAYAYPKDLAKFYSPEQIKKL